MSSRIPPWARAVLPMLALLLLTAPPAAQDQPCPLPGQTQVLLARLYFGQSIAGRAPLTAQEWRSFLAQAVTPRFPDGFTVYDAKGQWQAPGAHAIAHENSKVIEIAAPDTPDALRRIEDIAHLYQDKFKQQSVGVVTSTACAAF
jgi:Protein of unknown function (DUF3574)